VHTRKKKNTAHFKFYGAWKPRSQATKAREAHGYQILDEPKDDGDDHADLVDDEPAEERQPS
jgi:hypothetical protein